MNHLAAVRPLITKSYLYNPHLSTIYTEDTKYKINQNLSSDKNIFDIHLTPLT